MEITLILVRHGQASHNVKGSEVIFNFKEEGENRVLDTDLTETGRQQAQKVAERLSQKKIDLAISSDLRRALDTALAVASRHNNIQVSHRIFPYSISEQDRRDVSGYVGAFCFPVSYMRILMKNIKHVMCRSTLGNLLARETADALRKIPR